MWHPIASSKRQHYQSEQAEQPKQLEPAEEEPQPTKLNGTTTWKPLVLSSVLHPRHEPEPSTSSTTLGLGLPTKVPEKYHGRSDNLHHYALYALAHLSRDDISDILQVVKEHSPHRKETERPVPRVSRAPIYDFCNQKTLGDIYSYHTSLLEDSSHDIARGRFVVAPHSDWETNGVLIVDFDCKPNESGTLGILRVHASAIPHCLMLLERSNRAWADLKAIELDTKWLGTIPGYTGSRWQTLGFRYCDTKWLKGEY